MIKFDRASNKRGFAKPERVESSGASNGMGCVAKVRFVSPKWVHTQGRRARFTKNHKTYGDKAQVDSIYAIRTRVKGDPPLVCDYSADVSVLAPRGRVKWFGHQKHVGCTPVRAFFKLNVNRTFRCGDETSIGFYENKAPQGGYAIMKLNCR